MPTHNKSTHNAITLRPALLEDITLIQKLAHSIWHAHYIPIIGAKQVSYMLNAFYSTAALKKQFSTHHVFYILQHPLHGALGFLSVEMLSEGSYKIHKFYIETAYANLGIGTHVFTLLNTLLHAKEFTLTVNRQNYRSINFYFKLGFKITSVADFDIGNGFVMNDFIMKWTLKHN